jgi:hypothetical protein
LLSSSGKSSKSSSVELIEDSDLARLALSCFLFYPILELERIVLSGAINPIEFFWCRIVLPLGKTISFSITLAYESLLLAELVFFGTFGVPPNLSSPVAIKGSPEVMVAALPSIIL